MLYQLVAEFVRAVGLGVLQLLILDRGFIDGPNISRCKKEFEIDVLISMKKKMDIWEDAWALGKRESWQSFAVPAPKAQAPVKDRPAALARREAKRQQTLAQRRPAPDPAQVLTHREFCGLKGFSSWSQASVPIHVLFMRERYGDGHLEEWGLLTTRDYREVRQPREDYQLRVKIEERHRLLKCFHDLSDFCSRDFNVIAAQVVFILLS
ncbi:MAG: transposase [Verrucomicrobiota bacterium]